MDFHRIKKSLNYILYILILLIPFTHKESFSIYLPDLILSKWVLIVISVISIVLLIKNFRYYLSDFGFVFLLSHFVFTLFSIFQSRDITSTVSIIIYILTIVLLYVFITYLVKDSITFNNVLFIYSLSAIITFVFLGLQIYLQENFDKAIGGVWPVPGFSSRYGSTFWDVNHYGAYLCSIIFICFAQLSNSRKNLIKMMILISIITASFLGIYLTSSRSSIIGLSVGFITILPVFILNIKNQNKTKINVNISYVKRSTALIFALLFPLIPIVVTTVFLDYIKSAFLYRGVSFFSHMYLVKAGMEIGINNFIFGIGANGFSEYFRTSKYSDSYFYIDAAAKSFKLPLHNLWLEVFVETGVISFLLYVVGITIISSVLIKSYKISKNYSSLFLLGGLISFMTGGLFYSYKNEFYWVFICLILAFVSIIVNNGIETGSGIKNLISYLNFDKRNNSRYIKLLIIVFSLLNLLIPLFYIISPLLYYEVTSLNNIVNNNLYSHIILLFRYVYGNYIFVGRIVSLLFYIPVVILSFSLFKKFFATEISLFFTSVLVIIYTFYNPILSISPVLFSIFVILLIVYSIINYSSLNINFELKNYFRPYMMLILCLSLGLCILQVYLNNNTFNSSINKDLIFLSELTYNRGLLDKSYIFTNDSDNKYIISYFCDKIVISNGLYSKLDCDIIDTDSVDLSKLPDLTKKAVYLMKDSTDSISLPAESDYIDVLKLTDYTAVIYDPKIKR